MSSASLTPQLSLLATNSKCDDSCKTCYWPTGHNCMTTWTKTQCGTNPAFVWCGEAGESSSSSTTPSSTTPSSTTPSSTTPEALSSCTSKPCKNEGHCSNVCDGGYSCVCSGGFLGKNCEQKGCSTSCTNNSVCDTASDPPKCSCPTCYITSGSGDSLTCTPKTCSPACTGGKTCSCGVCVTDSLRSNNKIQGIYLKTWAGGWQASGILKFFQDLNGLADMTFITFAKPTASGLDWTGQSPGSNVYDSKTQKNVSAKTFYKQGAQLAKSFARPMITFISIGGWSYRDDFSSISDVDAWATAVAKEADELGADGVDIDYEGQAGLTQWNKELVDKGVLPALRKALGETKYIALTIPALAGISTSIYGSVGFKPPLTSDYSKNTGWAADLINKHGQYFDFLQLMTYDGDPNLDPKQAGALCAQSFPKIKDKILIGAELGEQFGACKGNSTAWCKFTVSNVTSMGKDILSQNYKGMFYWPNIDISSAKSYYNASDAAMKL